MDIFIVFVYGVILCLIYAGKLDSTEGYSKFNQGFDDGEVSSRTLISIALLNDTYVKNAANNPPIGLFSSKTSNSAKHLLNYSLSRFLNSSIDDQKNKRNLSDVPEEISEKSIQSFIETIISIKRFLGGNYTYNTTERKIQWSTRASISNFTRNSTSYDLVAISGNDSDFSKISRRSTGYGVYNSNAGQYAQQNSGQGGGYYGSGQQNSYGNQQYTQQSSYSSQGGGYGSYGSGSQVSYGNQQNGMYGNNGFSGQGYGYGNNAYQPSNGGYGYPAQGGTYGQNSGYTNIGYTGSSGQGGYSTGGSGIFNSGFFSGTPYGSGTDPFDEWISAFDAGYDAGVNSISNDSKDKQDDKDKDKNKKNKDKNENNNVDENNPNDNDNGGGNDNN